jgi:hypothetical protein
MKMRDAAKEGLERMEDVGQMGNADTAPAADEDFDDGFDTEIDDIIGEVDGELQMAQGGFVAGQDLSRAPKNPAVDVRYFKHRDGRIMFVTFINNRPMTAIPEGFTQTDRPEQQVGKAAEERKEAAASGGGGDGGGGGNGAGDMGIGAFPLSGGGSGGDSDRPGAGISVTGQNVAFSMLSAAERAKQLALVNPLAAGLLYLGGKGAESYLDSQIDKMSAAEKAVATPSPVGGIGTFAATDGGISTISTPDLINKYDMEQFGVTSAQLDAERAARIVDENRIAEQARQEDVARAEAAARAAQEAAAKAEAQRAEAQRAYDARVAAERKAEADRAAAAKRAADQRAAEQRAREVANNPGSWSDSQRSEAAETGMVSVGGVSVSNDATIAAQNEAMFGGDSNNGGGGGSSNDGTYCCSRMVHLGMWGETKELARMHVWHHAQPKWWIAGYSVWGKIVANTLFRKKGFWTDVMQAFYDHRIKNKPRTLKSVIADLVIYPGVFVCSMLWRNAPENTRYVSQDEMK